MSDITDAQVYVMCAYVRGEPCHQCPSRVDTPYGHGQPGCHAVAEETLLKAREILLPVVLTPADIDTTLPPPHERSGDAEA